MASLLLALLLSPALAVDVVWREVRTGALSNGARDVAEDAEGFLWFATENGLVRYDGERTILFQPPGEQLSTWRVIVALGSIYAASRSGALYRLEQGVLEPVLRDGEHVLAERVTGNEQSLWVVQDGRVVLWDGRRWIDMTPKDFEGRAFHLRTDHDGLLVGTSHGLWRIGPDSRPRLRSGLNVDAARLSDGRLMVLGKETVLRDGHQETVLLEHQNSRAVSLVVRDDIGYVAYDRYLFRVSPDGAVARFDPAHHGGPPLAEQSMIASDGTLWMGTIFVPEPDVTGLGPDEGVGLSGRWVTAAPDGRVYYSSWQGLAVLDGNGLLEHPQYGRRSSMTCMDDSGRALAFVPGPDAGIWDLAAPALLVPGAEGADCSPSSNGGMWMVGYGELWEVGEEIVHYPALTEAYRAVVETNDGQLILVGGHHACEASVAAVRARDPAAWHCTELPHKVGPNIVAAVQASPGVVWVGTEGDGLWERTGPHQWRASLLNAQLSVRAVGRLEVSDEGGVWIQQGTQIVRVQQVDGIWTVTERLDERLGVRGASDVDEDADGNLWVATRTGLVRVPANRRRLAPPSFTPRLLAARVDGQPAQTPLSAPSGGAVDLDFSALAPSWSDSLRYRWRLVGGAWSTPATSGTIRLAGLAAGSQRIEVQSAADGQAWGPSTHVNVEVIPALHQRPLAWAVLGLFGLVGLLVVQRLRGRVALETERQRALIAMDLHDELGAGLGSISILAGLLNSARVPQDRRQDAARRIAATAEELGAAVTDIVWSLRTPRHDLHSLAHYLLERGRGMLGAAPVDLQPAFADPLPRDALPAPVARAVQRILTEALYNAARHANARTIQLSVQPDGDRWCVAVQDDGVGFEQSPGPRPGGGTGLASMQARADAIDARLQITSGPDGTRVALTL